jgi:hypothetical protein
LRREGKERINNSESSTARRGDEKSKRREGKDLLSTMIPSPRSQSISTILWKLGRRKTCEISSEWAEKAEISQRDLYVPISRSIVQEYVPVLVSRRSEHLKIREVRG